ASRHSRRAPYSANSPFSTPDRVPPPSSPTTMSYATRSATRNSPNFRKRRLPSPSSCCRVSAASSAEGFAAPIRPFTSWKPEFCIRKAPLRYPPGWPRDNLAHGVVRLIRQFHDCGPKPMMIRFFFALTLVLTTFIVVPHALAQSTFDGDQPGYVPKEDEEQLDPKWQKTVVFYRTTETPGTIIVNTNERFLYVVQGG